jgi:hypothetical protein
MNARTLLGVESATWSSFVLCPATRHGIQSLLPSCCKEKQAPPQPADQAVRDRGRSAERHRPHPKESSTDPVSYKGPGRTLCHSHVAQFTLRPVSARRLYDRAV